MPIWKVRRMHTERGLVPHHPYLRKKKDTANWTHSPKLYWQLAGVQVQIPMIGCFPTIVHPLLVFTPILKSFSLPSLITLNSFLIVWPPHLFLLSVCALHVTTILNVADVVQFPSFWLRVNKQWFWLWLYLHHSKSAGWFHLFLWIFCIHMAPKQVGVGSEKGQVVCSLQQYMY